MPAERGEVYVPSMLRVADVRADNVIKMIPDNIRMSNSEWIALREVLCAALRQWAESDFRSGATGDVLIRTDVKT